MDEEVGEVDLVPEWGRAMEEISWRHEWYWVGACELHNYDEMT